MAKRRKNIGRVKRYNHNFYRSGRTYWAKRILTGLVVVALVFVLGFVVAPGVLDWGTNFWYDTIKHEEHNTAQPTPPAENDTPDQDASSEVEDEPVEPTAEPAAPEASGYTAGSLKMLSLSALQSPDAMETAAQELHDQGVTYGVVPLKDESGYLYYDSAVPQAAASIAATTIDPAAVAAALRAKGVQPVASIAAFKDPMVDRAMGIQYVGQDYTWLDNKAEAGGKRWANPYDPAAVQYIGDLIQEAKDMGFDIVILSGVQFPRQESPKQDFGDTGGRDRAAQLRADIAAWEERFEGSCTLVYEVPYESCVTPSSTLGTVLPSELGIKKLMVEAASEEPDEDAEGGQAPITQEEVFAALRAGGVESIAVRDGVTGEVLPQP